MCGVPLGSITSTPKRLQSPSCFRCTRTPRCVAFFVGQMLVSGSRRKECLVSGSSQVTLVPSGEKCQCCFCSTLSPSHMHYLSWRWRWGGEDARSKRATTTWQRCKPADVWATRAVQRGCRGGCMPKEDLKNLRLHVATGVAFGMAARDRRHGKPAKREIAGATLDYLIKLSHRHFAPLYPRSCYKYVIDSSIRADSATPGIRGTNIYTSAPTRSPEHPNTSSLITQRTSSVSAPVVLDAALCSVAEGVPVCLYSVVTSWNDTMPGILFISWNGSCAPQYQQEKLWRLK